MCSSQLCGLARSALLLRGSCTLPTTSSHDHTQAQQSHCLIISLFYFGLSVSHVILMLSFSCIFPRESARVIGADSPFVLTQGNPSCQCLIRKSPCVASLSQHGYPPLIVTLMGRVTFHITLSRMHRPVILKQTFGLHASCG